MLKHFEEHGTQQHIFKHKLIRSGKHIEIYSQAKIQIEHKRCSNFKKTMLF